MPQTQKYIMGISGVVILALLGYLAFQNMKSSQSDDIVNTGANTSISQSGIETDSGERLKTLSNSGTQWGMTPFGSGKPLTEAEKPVFQKPNTEWKTRTLSGITYKFGEGNPSGVALNMDQIKAINSTCASETSSDISPEAQKLIDSQVCSQESGEMFYVSPEVEKYLLLALSDPNWNRLATECEKNFRFIETSDTFVNAQNDPEYPLFDRVFSPGWLDMDRYLYIDPNTGLKLLNRGRINNIAGFLVGASHYGQRKGESPINPHGDCVDRYATEIARNLYIAQDLYRSPLSYPQGYTNQFFLSKDFNLSQF